MPRRFGTFTGGIDLPDEKHSTLDAPIAPFEGLRCLSVPLALCEKAQIQTHVRPGQRVDAGAKLASSADGACAYAPVSGRITKMTTARVAGPDGFETVPAAKMTDFGEYEPEEPSRETIDWLSADAEELRSRLADGGLAVCRRGRGPLSGWMDSARRNRCRTLIANAVEVQPYMTADHRLLVERTDQVAAGLAILARAIEAEEMLLAVDWRRTGDYRELVAQTRAYDIKRIALPHKYPVEADNVLVKVLLRREVPPGAGPMSAGAAVIDAATCLAAFRWVAFSLPPTGRVVTISGERIESPGNYLVPFGADFRELTGNVEPPVIHGGPMTGSACEPGVVVSPATTALLALEPSDNHGPPGPCIRCGWCTDHCPARLNVSALNDDYELSLVEHARLMHVTACVGCGVCSYVCPARLPLSGRVRELKRAVREDPAGSAP